MSDYIAHNIYLLKLITTDIILIKGISGYLDSGYINLDVHFSRVFSRT